MSSANDEISVVRYLLQHKCQLFDSSDISQSEQRTTSASHSVSADRSSVVDASPVSCVRGYNTVAPLSPDRNNTTTVSV